MPLFQKQDENETIPVNSNVPMKEIGVVVNKLVHECDDTDDPKGLAVEDMLQISETQNQTAAKQ